jgi:hypothetical protein
MPGIYIPEFFCWIHLSFDLGSLLILDSHAQWIMSDRLALSHATPLHAEFHVRESFAEHLA